MSNYGRSDYSGSDDRYSPLPPPALQPSSFGRITAPTIRIILDNLSWDVEITAFDLFSFLPPHVQPDWFDLPPRQGIFSHGAPRGPGRPRWAAFVFDHLEPAILCWAHLHHLLAGGYLSHLFDAPDGVPLHPPRSLRVIRMLPPASYVMLAWQTVRSILPTQPTTPFPLVHISNLRIGVTANDIASVLPPDLLSMVASIKALRPDQSLTRRDIPIDVGRVNVYFDSMDAASEFYEGIQEIRLEGGPLWKLRHFGAGKPGIVSPGILWLVMEAWISLGGERLHEMLMSSLCAYT